MKAHAILAALLIAAPAASFAGHRPQIFLPAPVRAPIIHPPLYPGVCPPVYPSRHLFSGGPFLSFSFVSRPRVYETPRYYEPFASSLESDVQRALRRQGYYNGPVDGDIGPRSRAAIRDYQADYGLPITGRLDGALLRSLGI